MSCSQAAPVLTSTVMREGLRDPGLICLGFGGRFLRLRRARAERMLRDIRLGAGAAGWEAETIMVAGETFSRAECEQLDRVLCGALDRMAHLYRGCGE